MAFNTWKQTQRKLSIFCILQTCFVALGNWQLDPAFSYHVQKCDRVTHKDWWQNMPLLKSLFRYWPHLIPLSLISKNVTVHLILILCLVLNSSTQSSYCMWNSYFFFPETKASEQVAWYCKTVLTAA